MYVLACSPRHGKRLKAIQSCKQKGCYPQGPIEDTERTTMQTQVGANVYVSCLWFLFWVIYKCPHPKTEQQWMVGPLRPHTILQALFYCESIRALWTEYVAYSWPAPLSILYLFKLIHSQLLPAACSPPPHFTRLCQRKHQDTSTSWGGEWLPF